MLRCEYSAIDNNKKTPFECAVLDGFFMYTSFNVLKVYLNGHKQTMTEKNRLKCIAQSDNTTRLKENIECCCFFCFYFVSFFLSGRVALMIKAYKWRFGQLIKEHVCVCACAWVRLYVFLSCYRCEWNEDIKCPQFNKWIKRNEVKKNALGERESPPTKMKYAFNKSQFILGIVVHNMQYP